MANAVFVLDKSNEIHFEGETGELIFALHPGCSPVWYNSAALWSLNVVMRIQNVSWLCFNLVLI